MLLRVYSDLGNGPHVCEIAGGLARDVLVDRLVHFWWLVGVVLDANALGQIGYTTAEAEAALEDLSDRVDLALLGVRG